MPDAPLSDAQFEKMMEQLEAGIKATQGRDKKKKKVSPEGAPPKKTSPKKLSVSSALENQKKKGTGVTSGVAALRNEAASMADLDSPKKKYP